VSRRLADLHPALTDMAINWLSTCRERGLDPLVTCTSRTNAEQTALYAQGRTKPGQIVTNAKAGQSAHNYGLALDFVPMINGKIEWNAKHPHWQLIGEIAESVGFEWAGRWTKFREFPHIQLPSWRDYIRPLQ
jgi:peptidoglycan L-alanyl-D-glutamate endopeptidase CwlK